MERVNSGAKPQVRQLSMGPRLRGDDGFQGN
jgi:hypothetical protein